MFLKKPSPLQAYIKKKMLKPRCSKLVNLYLKACHLPSWQELFDYEFSKEKLKFYFNYEIDIYVAAFYDFFFHLSHKNKLSKTWLLISDHQEIKPGDITAYVPLRYKKGDARPDKGNHIVFIEKIYKRQKQGKNFILTVRVLDSVMTSNHTPILEKTKSEKSLRKFDLKYYIFDKKRSIGSGVIQILIDKKSHILGVQHQLGGKWKKRKGFIARPQKAPKNMCS